MELLLILVALIVVIAVAWIFNRLVALRNRARSAWSDIDVQLKQRHDLIGNLVEVVKGYARHERQTLEEVTALRTEAEGIRKQGNPGEAGKAESKLGLRIRRLFAVVEAYPELKASESFLGLHRGLVDVEDKIQSARRYYNAVVRDLNTRIQSFPDLLLAKPLGFRERDFFELDSEAEAAVPRIDLGDAS